MKKLLFIFFVLTSFLSKAQQIIYTPQTAAGYQFKYGKFDSGFNLPYKDRSLGRGITRGGAVIFDSTGKHFYGWNETNWVLLDDGGISNVTIIDSSHIQICNLSGCDTLTTSVTAQLVTILSDTSLMVCDTLFACDTFYVSPTQFVQNIFDTTSIYNAIYDIRNFLGDTSFTNQFMPNLGVVTDTIVKIDSTITRYVFTDGTYKEDTSKVYFTQDNITAITNILNYIDSVNGFDTTFIRNYQLLDGEEIVTVSTDSLTRNDTLNFDYNVEGKAGRVLSNDGTNLQWVLTSDHHQNGLVYGGVVTWLHDYVYNISAAGYYIDDVFYESPSTDVTLDPADATNDRIDLFALTTSSIAIDITGTPAGTPVEPDYDANTQLKISFAIVYANTTEPPAPGVEWIYKENVEWATTASGPTINPASTNNPFAGTLDVEGTNVGNAAYINFVSTSPVDWTKYNYLTFQIRSKGNFQNSKKIVFRFMSSINNAVGNNVPVGSGSYGFISTQTASYQTISIPLSDFGSIGTADRLRITESNTSGTAGWYLDNIQLQYIPQATPNVSVVFYGKNATRDSTVLLLSNGTRFAAFDSSATGGSVADGSETIVTAGTNVTVTGTGTSGNPYVVNSTAAGSTVNNAGSGYRLVTTDGTEIKTVFGSNTITVDSSSNAPGITFKADTSQIATQYDLTQIAGNTYTAGTNIAISGGNVISASDSAAYHNVDVYQDSLLLLSDLNGRVDTLSLSAINYWNKNVNDLYYNEGNVGIGVDTPYSPLHITKNLEVVNTGQVAPGSDSSGITIESIPSGTVTMKQPGSIVLKGSSWNTTTSTPATTRLRLTAVQNSFTNVTQMNPSFWIEGSINDGVTYNALGKFQYTASSGPALIMSNSSFGNAATVGSTLIVQGVLTANTGVLSNASGNITSGNGTTERNIFTNTFSASGSAGTSTFTGLKLTGLINFTAGTNTVRGIYYAPTFSGTTGLTHIAYENTTGDIKFNTTSGQVILNTPLRLKGYTVATLPAGTVGDEAYVTDATAPTYLGALTGGGAVVCPVFYNGAAWVSH